MKEIWRGLSSPYFFLCSFEFYRFFFQLYIIKVRDKE
nr:MAG TPA: hypothetical protein [Bacteriophage sp.]